MASPNLWFTSGTPLHPALAKPLWPESKRETEAPGGGSVESDRQGLCLCKCHREQHSGTGSERDTAGLLPTQGTQLSPNPSSLASAPPSLSEEGTSGLSKLQGVCAASSCQLRCFCRVSFGNKPFGPKMPWEEEEKPSNNQQIFRWGENFCIQT